jgi:hypothetical protein
MAGPERIDENRTRHAYAARVDTRRAAAASDDGASTNMAARAQEEHHKEAGSYEPTLADGFNAYLNGQPAPVIVRPADQAIAFMRATGELRAPAPPQSAVRAKPEWPPRLGGSGSPNDGARTPPPDPRSLSPDERRAELARLDIWLPANRGTPNFEAERQYYVQLKALEQDDEAKHARQVRAASGFARPRPIDLRTSDDPKTLRPSPDLVKTIADAKIELAASLANAHDVSSDKVADYVEAYLRYTGSRPELRGQFERAERDGVRLVADALEREEAELKRQLELQAGKLHVANTIGRLQARPPPSIERSAMVGELVMPIAKTVNFLSGMLPVFGSSTMVAEAITGKGLWGLGEDLDTTERVIAAALVVAPAAASLLKGGVREAAMMLRLADEAKTSVSTIRGRLQAMLTIAEERAVIQEYAASLRSGVAPRRETVEGMLRLEGRLQKIPGYEQVQFSFPFKGAGAIPARYKTPLQAIETSALPRDTQESLARLCGSRDAASRTAASLRSSGALAGRVKAAENAIGIESRKIGEEAAEGVVRSRYPGPPAPQKVYPPAGAPSRSGDFDQVWKVTIHGEEKTVVVEAKGGTSDIKSRNVGVTRAEQGTRGYYDDIVKNMQKSKDSAMRATGDMLQGSTADNVIYLHVSAPIDTSGGKSASTIVKVGEFDIHY